jgi:hypothetical protein
MVCGDEYIAMYGNLRRGKAHQCSPWKKYGYQEGELVNGGQVKLLGPDYSGRQERCRCQCMTCGDEYLAGYSVLSEGQTHKCSPWKKRGYQEGQLLCDGQVKLLGPIYSGRRERCRCECIVCGDEYIAEYCNLRRVRAHQCSPWKKYGYQEGQLLCGDTVKLLGPDCSSKGERCRCECVVCGDEYIAGYGDLRKGNRHLCSPWKKYGYQEGELVNGGKVKLLGPDYSGRQERCRCQCTVCGDEYIAGYANLRNGSTHKCSPWKKYGYQEGQLLCDDRVKLLGPDCSVSMERCRCECMVCGDEYIAMYGNLRKGKSHQCTQTRDYTGRSCDEFSVVCRQGPGHWLVALTSGGEAILSGAEVCMALDGDLVTIDTECAAAIRNATKGIDSPWLHVIGTTVEEVRFYLPLHHRNDSRDHLGHIIPRSFCKDRDSRIESWRPANLRWQSGVDNMSLGGLPWGHQFCPSARAFGVELVAMALPALLEAAKARRGSRINQVSDERLVRWGCSPRSEALAVPCDDIPDWWEDDRMKFCD